MYDNKEREREKLNKPCAKCRWSKDVGPTYYCLWQKCINKKEDRAIKKPYESGNIK